MHTSRVEYYIGNNVTSYITIHIYSMCVEGAKYKLSDNITKWRQSIFVLHILIVSIFITMGIRMHSRVIYLKQYCSNESEMGFVFSVCQTSKITVLIPPTSFPPTIYNSNYSQEWHHGLHKSRNNTMNCKNILIVDIHDYRTVTSALTGIFWSHVC